MNTNQFLDPDCPAIREYSCLLVAELLNQAILNIEVKNALSEMIDSSSERYEARIFIHHYGR
jgi:hypothetical protein